jgi:hypothetical protein
VSGAAAIAMIAMSVSVILFAVANLCSLRRHIERDLLLYLMINPGWHYGLDLVAAGLAGRSSIYVHLGRLQERGLVERIDSGGFWDRPMYRATPVKP